MMNPSMHICISCHLSERLMQGNLFKKNVSVVSITNSEDFMESCIFCGKFVGIREIEIEYMYMPMIGLKEMGG